MVIQLLGAHILQINSPKPQACMHICYTLRADQNHMAQEHEPQAILNSSFEIHSKHITINCK